MILIYFSDTYNYSVLTNKTNSDFSKFVLFLFGGGSEI